MEHGHPVQVCLVCAVKEKDFWELVNQCVSSLLGVNQTNKFIMGVDKWMMELIICYDSSPTRSGLGDEIESHSLTKQ